MSQKLRKQAEQADKICEDFYAEREKAQKLLHEISETFHNLHINLLKILPKDYDNIPKE